MAVFVALLSGAAVRHLFEAKLFATVAAALVAFSCTSVAPVYILLTGNRTAAQMRTFAPMVQSFALAHFDEIDVPDNGVLVEFELNQAASKFPGRDKQMLEYMRAHLSDMGHVIGSYTTTSTSYLMVGRVMIPQTHTNVHEFYGITRADLNEYPARVIERYSNWK